MIPHRVVKGGITLAVTFLALAGSASAVVTTITANATYLRSNDPDINHGADPIMILGNSETGYYRVLLSFSMSSIPANATISSVSLGLTRSSTDGTSFNLPVTINLHEMTTAFSEGNGMNAGAGTNNGSASWNSKGPTSTAWSTVGGDYDSPVLSNMTKNPTNLLPAWTFASTSGFVAAAQNALGGNLSLLLKQDTAVENLTNRRVFFLHSDDAVTSTDRPILTVTYTIPEPATASLAAFAAAAMMVRRRRM